MAVCSTGLKRSLRPGGGLRDGGLATSAAGTVEAGWDFVARRTIYY